MIVVERAISLTQPWATLMAMGWKRIETRSWSTNFRGWIAIHAAMGFPPAARALCAREPFAETLFLCGHAGRDHLPRGQILAVVEVVGCRRASHVGVHALELAFGDYSTGRWCFLTAGVRRLREPLIVKGAQRIWRLPAPITEAELVPAGGFQSPA
jgi:hypothetical protein